MKQTYIFLFALSLLFPINFVEAQTFGRFYSGNNSGNSIGSSGNGGSGSRFNRVWRGGSSGFVRNFGRSGGSGGYFGVPTGSSVGGNSFISRPHRAAYRAQIRAARIEQARLDNLPPPCGLYGRLPRRCEVKRFGSQ